MTQVQFIAKTRIKRGSDKHSAKSIGAEHFAEIGPNQNAHLVASHHAGQMREAAAIERAKTPEGAD